MHVCMFVEVSCWEYHITSRPPFFFEIQGERPWKLWAVLESIATTYRWVIICVFWGSLRCKRHIEDLIWLWYTQNISNQSTWSHCFDTLGGGTSLNCFAKVKVNAQLSQSIKKELQKYEARWAIHEMGASNRVECLERNTDPSASHDVTWTKYTVTFKSGLSPKVRFQLCLSTISPSSSGHGKDPLLEGKWHFSDSGEESDPLYFSMF